MRILHLAADFGPTATGRRVSRLAEALLPFPLTQTAISLQPGFFFEPPIPVQQVTLRPWLDISGWLTLRAALAKAQPEIIHCWGRRAAEVLSIIRPAGRLFRTFDGRDTVFSRQTGERLELPPFVNPPAAINREQARQALGLSPQHRVVMACDNFQTTQAKLAVWSIDLLKYTAPEWRLVLLGDGPARGRIERYARHLAADDPRTLFLGARPSQPVLAAADYFWQIRPVGGLHLILEALACGLPIIGLPNPALPQPPEDYMIPARDAVAFAARTRDLEQNADRRAQLAQAARGIAQRFPVQACVERLLQAYGIKNP